MRHQEFEQAVLDAAQVQRLAARRHAVGGRVEDQLVARQRRLVAFEGMRSEQSRDTRATASRNENGFAM